MTGTGGMEEMVPVEETEAMVETPVPVPMAMAVMVVMAATEEETVVMEAMVMAPEMEDVAEMLAGEAVTADKEVKVVQMEDTMVLLAWEPQALINSLIARVAMGKTNAL